MPPLKFVALEHGSPKSLQAQRVSTVAAKSRKSRPFFSHSSSAICIPLGDRTLGKPARCVRDGLKGRRMQNICEIGSGIVTSTKISQRTNRGVKIRKTLPIRQRGERDRSSETTDSNIIGKWSLPYKSGRTRQVKNQEDN